MQLGSERRARLDAVADFLQLVPVFELAKGLKAIWSPTPDRDFPAAQARVN
jgi:hypothetical protein